MLLVYCATPARIAKEKWWQKLLRWLLWWKRRKKPIEKIMDFVTKQSLGPFHPFQAFEYKRFEGGPIGRKRTIEFCCRAIDICDEFWLFGISEGTLTELCYALKKQKPIKLFLNEFDKDWQVEYEGLKDSFNDPLSKMI